MRPFTRTLYIQLDGEKENRRKKCSYKRRRAVIDAPFDIRIISSPSFLFLSFPHLRIPSEICDIEDKICSLQIIITQERV